MNKRKVFWKIFWGLGFILAALLLIVDALGIIAPLESFAGKISIFSIIAAFLLIAFMVSQLIYGRVYWIFFPIALIYILFEKNVATIAGLEKTNIIHHGIVITIAGLLTIGFVILFSSRKKKKRTSGVSFECSANKKDAENKFGSSVIYVDCTDFTPCHIENNMGDCSVYFENIASYCGGKTIHVENNLGSICINVPRGWIVKSSIDTHLGGTGVETNEVGCGPLLYINGENKLGSISVRYV